MKFKLTVLLMTLCVVAPCNGASRLQRIMRTLTAATRVVEAPARVGYGDMLLTPVEHKKMQSAAQEALQVVVQIPADTVVISADVTALLNDLTTDVHPLLKTYYDSPEAFAKAVAASVDMGGRVGL